MKQNSAYYIIAKALTLLGDFAVLNLVLAAFLSWGGKIVPPFFIEKIALAVYLANASMFASELIFPPVVLKRRVKFYQVASRVLSLVVLQSVIMFVSLRLLSNGGGFFNFIWVFAAALYVGILASHYVELFVLKSYRKRGGNTRRVVLVGNDEALLILYRLMVSDTGSGYRVLGYFSNKPFDKCPSGLKHLGTIEQMNAVMGDFDHAGFDDSTGLKNVTHPSPIVDADEVFVSMSHDDMVQIVRIMRFCQHALKRFYYVPRLFYGFHINLKMETFGDLVVFTDLEEPLNKPWNKFVKRLFDIAFSAVVCLCLLPFVPIIGLLIKIQSPGPIFFLQERTGLNGKPFKLVKFRSMRVNSVSDKLQATKDDPRKFPFGDFMRKTNIDELPQFFNVLKGDMSVVGPRPHMLMHTEIYSQLIDKYMVRHFSKPGITGWAQATGARGETKELWQMEKRVRRDIWYIENWSVWLDMKIIFLTFVSIFHPNENAY